MASGEIPNQLKHLEIPGRLTVLEGNGELPKIEVTSDWSTAEIYLHGAHITDFQKKGEPRVLFTSQCSRFATGQPIRGGIPVIFPWFGAREGMPAHGFMRVVDWQLHEAITVPDGGVSLRFGFPETVLGSIWTPFRANYVVTVTDKLVLELIITNAAADQDLTFENCLHSYFAVGDISEVSVVGLQGAHYLDKVENFASKTEGADAIRITGETDRVYLDAKGPVEILDAKWGRRIRIEKENSASTVVWNPWLTKSQQIPDFCNDDYRQMVCVESGNVDRNKIQLAPGKSAVLKVTLTTAPL